MHTICSVRSILLFSSSLQFVSALCSFAAQKLRRIVVFGDDDAVSHIGAMVILLCCPGVFLDQ
jgi:hypothetical protein